MLSGYRVATCCTTGRAARHTLWCDLLFGFLLKTHRTVTTNALYPLLMQEANEPLALEPWDEEGGFDVKGTGDLYFAPYDDHGNLQNLACHRACYSLLGKEFRYKLKLSDVQHLAKGDFQAHLMTSDYGGIFKYQYQARTLWMCARMWYEAAQACLCHMFTIQRKLIKGSCSSFLNTYPS